jgi:hypothetical protein
VAQRGIRGVLEEMPHHALVVSARALRGNRAARGVRHPRVIIVHQARVGVGRAGSG